MIVSRFNPTLVRLRRLKTQAGGFDSRRFNPTLVRLRQGKQAQISDQRGEFQSHAGSIEAWYVPSLCSSETRSFNPTLVRLRPLRRVQLLTPRETFQSHAGSIEATAQMDLNQT